jgi:hypothetical protein
MLPAVGCLLVRRKLRTALQICAAGAIRSPNRDTLTAMAFSEETGWIGTGALGGAGGWRSCGNAA